MIGGGKNRSANERVDVERENFSNLPDQSTILKMTIHQKLSDRKHGLILQGSPLAVYQNYPTFMPHNLCRINYAVLRDGFCNIKNCLSRNGLKISRITNIKIITLRAIIFKHFTSQNRRFIFQPCII